MTGKLSCHKAQDAWYACVDFSTLSTEKLRNVFVARNGKSCLALDHDTHQGEIIADAYLLPLFHLGLQGRALRV